MCFVLINRVNLGNRIVGYELFSKEGKEIVGKTEKQIRDSIKVGILVKGFKVEESGNLVIDERFIKNLMIKTGIATFSSSNENSIVNLMYTVVGKTEGNAYEVVTSRFYNGLLPEDKIKTLYELGAVNGIEIDEKGNVQLVEAVKEPERKEIAIKEEIRPKEKTTA